MTDWADLFTVFLYGEGAWLGFLVFETFIIGLTFKWKYAGILMIPTCLFLAFKYFDNALGWQGLGMLFNAVFIITMLAIKKGKE
jgi:hypothetical protein